MAAAPSASFRMLQIAVHGMGVLLIVGLIAFGVALWWTSSREDPEAGTAAMAAGSAGRAVSVAPIAPFDAKTLPLPAGTRVLDMDVDGTLLVLRLGWSDAGQSPGAAGEFLWLYDLAQHKVLGELAIP